jgi:UDP-N-acetylglucosamine 4,6-dehydratase (inverting)
MFKNKNILITGGTGSFGQAFVKNLLKNYNIKKLIVFSRDELKQYEMSQLDHVKKNCNKIRFFIGDIRSKQRLVTAVSNDIDFLVHAAALKQVPSCEYNPFETIQTNVMGAQNIIEASIETGVKNVIALSTDKASSPINLYGTSKLASDKLFIAGNNVSKKTKFSIVRYGNVFGSRGSVIPLFLQKKEEGILPVTDKKMTRFNISLEDGIKFVIKSFKMMIGGEIFVPKLSSYNILDLAKAIDSKCKIKFIGIRSGEKLHEEMISFSESANTVEGKNWFAILPNSEFVKWKEDDFIKKNNCKKIKKPFSYNSFKNSKYLSITDLKNLVNEFISNNENKLR